MVKWSDGHVFAILLSCDLVDCKARRFARLDIFLIIISLFLTTVDLFAVDMYIQSPRKLSSHIPHLDFVIPLVV